MKYIPVIILILVGMMYVAPAREFVIDPPPEPEIVVDELDLFLEELIQYECRDCPENFRKVDVNGYYSYGCLQFQKATHEEQSKIYNLEGDIYSCEDQKVLARHMFENDPDVERHWITSIKKMNVDK